MLSPLQTSGHFGGLARKKREDLLEVEGIGEKGITEIKKVLIKFGLNLKE